MEIDGLFAKVEKQPIYRREKQRLFSAYSRTQQFHILSTLTFFFVNVPVGKTDKKDE